MQQHVATRKHEELQQVGWDRTERAKGIPGTWKIRRRKSRYCFIGKLNKLLGCSLSFFLFFIVAGQRTERRLQDTSRCYMQVAARRVQKSSPVCSQHHLIEPPPESSRRLSSSIGLKARKYSNNFQVWGDTQRARWIVNLRGFSRKGASTALPRADHTKPASCPSLT